MQLTHFEVNSPLLKPYIAFYYLLSTEGDTYASVYTAYPSNNTPLCFFKNSRIELSPGKADVKPDTNGTFTEIVVGNSADCLQVQMAPGIKEFCITFKPLGFNHLLPGKLGSLLRHELISTGYLSFLYPLIANILDGGDGIQQLETKLVDALQNHAALERLQQILDLINEEQLAIEAIAAKLFTTSKNINRLFNDHLGISPSQYRRIQRFRNVLTQGTNPVYKKKLARLAADSGYYDQPNLVNEVKKITRLSPKHFLSAVTLFANQKVAWKME